MTNATRSLLLSVTVLTATAAAQELTLRRDCEAGFRAFISVAQNGGLDPDVTNANVSVDGQRVVIELVRPDGGRPTLHLSPKQSAQTWSRYFDMALAEGATTADAQRVGAALDAAFSKDPFDIVASERSPGDGPIPGIAAAWGYGGWRAVARVLERRMMVLASVRYTVTVTAVLVVGLIASVLLLAGSVPPLTSPRQRGRGGDDH